MRLILLAASAFLTASAALGQPSAPAAPPSDSAAYMAQVAHQPGVTVTPSGLAYKVVKSGPAGAASPRLGDGVKVAYTGRLVDGTIFDSSDNSGGAVDMTVGQLVPGWNEALQMMHPGDQWTLYVPPALGYGDRSVGPIPPGSVMVFDLQLISVTPAGG